MRIESNANLIEKIAYSNQQSIEISTKAGLIHEKEILSIKNSVFIVMLGCTICYRTSFGIQGRWKDQGAKCW
jgi:hypothetical protein